MAEREVFRGEQTKFFSGKCVNCEMRTYTRDTEYDADHPHTTLVECVQYLASEIKALKEWKNS